MLSFALPLFKVKQCNAGSSYKIGHNFKHKTICHILFLCYAAGSYFKGAVCYPVTFFFWVDSGMFAEYTNSWVLSIHKTFIHTKMSHNIPLFMF